MREEQGLENIKNKMSQEQRKQMADLLTKELQARRSQATATNAAPRSNAKRDLSREDLSEVYRNVKEKISSKHNEPPRARLRRSLLPLHQSLQSVSTRNVVMVFAILACGAIKIMFSSGVVSASEGTSGKVAVTAMTPSLVEKNEATMTTNSATEKHEESIHPAAVEQAPDRRLVGWSLAEKTLLTQLDSRRVELERRKTALDEREAEIKALESNVSERLAELKSLTRKLEETKKEKDTSQVARLDQLANVYGSMAPNEAAPLIAKLDNAVALSLLERMPSKRMGQILGLMDADRAIELTRSLTGGKK